MQPYHCASSSLHGAMFTLVLSQDPPPPVADQSHTHYHEHPCQCSCLLIKNQSTTYIGLVYPRCQGMVASSTITYCYHSILGNLI